MQIQLETIEPGRPPKGAKFFGAVAREVRTSPRAIRLCCLGKEARQMADNGMWFKLWIGADEEPDLGDFSLEDFARWCKFGLYLKKYGTNGTIQLKEPCLPLQHKFKVTSFDLVLKCISMFPHCTVTGVTNATVTWENWLKYQGDNSIARVRRFRDHVTPKKRRDEMRRDEKRKDPPISPKGDVIDFAFQRFWEAYPKKKAKQSAMKAWKKEAAHLADIQDQIMAALTRQKKQSDWIKDNGQYIPNPASWLNGRRWEDEIKTRPDIFSVPSRTPEQILADRERERKQKNGK